MLIQKIYIFFLHRSKIQFKILKNKCNFTTLVCMSHQKIPPLSPPYVEWLFFLILKKIDSTLPVFCLFTKIKINKNLNFGKKWYVQSGHNWAFFKKEINKNLNLAVILVLAIYSYHYGIKWKKNNSANFNARDLNS